MWKLSCDITMNIQKSFRKKALFSCSMACLVDLCFDLEFSFRVKKLWKADPYSQYHAKGENMLHVWGAKGLTTALLEICAGGCSKRARDWGLVSRCLFPAIEVLLLSWVLLECLRLGCPCCPPYIALGSNPPLCAQDELLWECINLHMHCLTGVAGNHQGVLCVGSLSRQGGTWAALLFWAHCPLEHRAGKVSAEGELPRCH